MAGMADWLADKAAARMEEDGEWEDDEWEDDEQELDCGVVVYSITKQVEKLNDRVAKDGYPHELVERLAALDRELQETLEMWK